MDHISKSLIHENSGNWPWPSDIKSVKRTDSLKLFRNVLKFNPQPVIYIHLVINLGIYNSLVDFYYCIICQISRWTWFLALYSPKWFGSNLFHNEDPSHLGCFNPHLVTYETTSALIDTRKYSHDTGTLGSLSDFLQYSFCLTQQIFIY